MLKGLPTVSLSILCVGVNPTFSAYLLSAGDPIDLTLDTCNSVEVAKKKILSAVHDAYILDGSIIKDLDERFLLDLHALNHGASKVAITTHDAEQDKLVASFKERGLVDFIFTCPVTPQQIEDYFDFLIRSKPDAKNFVAAAKLIDLKKSYDSTIFDKLETLSRLIKEFQEKKDVQSLELLYDEIHKISGSAGTFGYDNVSKQAKQIGLEIRNRINTVTYDDHAWIATLDKFYDEIKLNFQISKEKDLFHTSSKVVLPKPNVFIIEHDQDFLDLLERVHNQFNLNLIWDSNPDHAIGLLSQTIFKLNVVVVAEKFPDSIKTGLQIIDEIKQKIKDPHLPLFALIIDEETLEIRMEAVKHGVDYIFRRPVSPFFLLKSLEEACEVKKFHDTKVLILDDDQDYIDLVTVYLLEMGVTVKSITSTKDLYKTLETYQPTIFLLDCNMPNYWGIDVLKTVRQDPRYKDLITVMVTGQNDHKTQLDAYSAKVDDILYKPIEKKVLQERIENLLHRHSLKETYQSVKEYTGLVNLKSFINKLNINSISSNFAEEFLVLVEVDFFVSYVKEFGNVAAMDLIVSVSNQFQLENDPKIQCFSYNPSTLAILFNNSREDTVIVKLERVLTEFRKKNTASDITFSCSVIPLAKELGNPQQILQRAEIGLKDAHRMPPTPVKLYVQKPQMAVLRQNLVVLIDPDKDLVKILTSALESHGFTVASYDEGKPALEAILKDLQPPALIISERKLPDMDGVEVYKKVKDHFMVNVPFFILTLYSSEKDLAEGVNLGITDYIVKPFNFSILMQKILKAAYR